jgi:divalent metal cation (Fe/Co/Zn/Cd) transporter
MGESGATSTTAGAPEASSLLSSGRKLEYFTIGWNVLEAVVSIFAGAVASSTALIGFGIDSAIESSSGAALLWRMQDRAGHAQRERRTLRLVGVSFLLLAAYVALDAGRTLILRDHTSPSILGIGIAVASLVVMPVLAHRKRVVAAQLDSQALHADSRQTSLCAYLSAILLGGLALNAALGWWWADSAAALVMIPIIAREGVEALRGERCDDCA